MADSNYEKVFRQYQEWFLQDNPRETADFLGLKTDREYLYIPFFGELCTITLKDGNIGKADGSAVPVEDRLTIMQHLHYHKKDDRESTKQVPFREIKEAAVFEKAYQKSALLPLVRNFSGKTKELLRAGLSIKGKQERFGDVSFTLQAFPKISLTYIFWDGDEEFPASANILFDDQIANWTHPESVPVLAETGTRKLIEAAGGERGFWVER